MMFPLGAQLHALSYWFFRRSDKAETRALHTKLRRLYLQHGLAREGAFGALITDITDQVATHFQLPADHPQRDVIRRLVVDLMETEDLFLLPVIDWSERRSISQYWALRDELNLQYKQLKHFKATTALLAQALIGIFTPLYAACPALVAEPDSGDTIVIPTTLVHCLPQLGTIIEQMSRVIASDTLHKANLCTRLYEQLERNIIAVSGGNPDDPTSFNRPFKNASAFESKDPAELVRRYLGGTPLTPLFEQTCNFSLPNEHRFAHHHIVAGSGHGKTQTLQYLIGCDLAAVMDRKRSVVVLDSQGDLIRTISQLAVFAPGGPLADRIVIIDPTDVEYPLSLNLFDVGMERLAGYAPLERERLVNSILELYDFVLGTLLAAEMTQKQSVIFRYVTRLMLHIPDATIHTLRELMEPNSQAVFAPHIAKLEGTARQFFATEFASKEFEQTKKQVLRRLWGILENQTFERMFSHPRSKLDLFTEMNSGKVILINTAKDLLKEQGTTIFGRFFIALIAQAAQERATVPEDKRLPTFVYIDEAADYVDRTIGIILAQARKYNVGLVLAHQYLGQLDGRLQEAFAANTAIKSAGGVSAKDAKSLAGMLYCDPSLIERQPVVSFATYVRGTTPQAVPLAFPYRYMEELPQMTAAERAQLQAVMRKKYAVHYRELGQAVAETSAHQDTQDDIDTDAGAFW